MPGIRATEDPDESIYVPRRRRSSPAPRMSLKERQAELAYDFVRAFLDVGRPIVPFDQSSFGSPHHPGWAVRRAMLKLVRDGALRGPVLLPKRDERGEMVWYQFNSWTAGSARGNAVVWAEGAWRLTYWYMPGWRIRAFAAEPTKRAKRRNREAAGKYRFETEQTRSNSVFRGVNPARLRTVEVHVPSQSQRAQISQYFRSLPKVDWDGRGYIPIPGPAMDALMEWRDSLPRAEKDIVETKRCDRCGGSFPRASWTRRRAHPLEECNVLVVARILTE